HHGHAPGPEHAGWAAVHFESRLRSLDAGNGGWRYLAWRNTIYSGWSGNCPRVHGCESMVRLHESSLQICAIADAWGCHGVDLRGADLLGERPGGWPGGVAT